MPSCSALYCNNRSEKGYKLYRFPKGERGAKWLRNMQRGRNWSPTESSRLCEVNILLKLFDCLCIMKHYVTIHYFSETL